MKKRRVLPRTQFGNPILQHKARKVEKDEIHTPEFQELVKDMLYTMKNTPSVGYAAPQIGVPIALAVLRPDRHDEKNKDRGHVVIINPKITEYSKKKVKGVEGCMSCRQIVGEVERSESITVEYIDEKGEKQREEASGWWARIFQHEVDHLNGIVFIERMDDMKKLYTTQEFRRQLKEAHERRQKETESEA